MCLFLARGMSVPKCLFPRIWSAWRKFLAGCPQGYSAQNFLFRLNFRFWYLGHTPSTAGTFQRKFRKDSGKTPGTLSELSWNSPWEYGWEPQSPFFQGTWSAFPEFSPPQYNWRRLFFLKWFQRGSLRAGHAISSSTEGIAEYCGERPPGQWELWEEHPRNRTIPTVLWVHRKLSQSTVSRANSSNKTYESKTGGNCTLAWKVKNHP